MKGECLALDWMSGEPAPKAVLELLSCQCNRLCLLPNCTCLANGLKCTALCKLQHCANQEEEATEEDTPEKDSDGETE